MAIHITCRKKALAIAFNVSKIKEYTRYMLNQCNCDEYNVSLLITDDQEIRDINRQYRYKDASTNVLSFPFSEATRDDPIASDTSLKELGDVIISIETAQREAIDLQQSIHTRLQWLITHGILHLLGYDHERSVHEAEKMYNREVELLKQFTTLRRTSMPKLAINVDHVATIRQARGGIEPDPVAAAAICELAGASGIVVHLREDRRHIQDRDVYLLRKTVKTKLNLEMGATKEIIDIALDVRPDMVTLVPEKRKELTTEGGLDVISQKKKIEKAIKRFDKASIPVSLFIDPDPDQIKVSHDIGATFVELHTGRYCDATTDKEREEEFSLIESSAEDAYNLGLIVNGGHGLDYKTTARVAALPTIDELSIGHAIISRAVFSGLERAVRDMHEIITNAQLQMYYQ